MRRAAYCLAFALFVLPIYAHATDATNFQRTVLVCGNGTGDRRSDHTDGVCSPPNVYFTGNFAANQINAAENPSDGFYLQSLPVSQSACEYTTVSNGGAGSGSGLDFRVAASGTAVGADTVTARAGGYFFNTAIYYTKEYEGINGGVCPDAAKDKPRGGFSMSNIAHRVDWDLETWIGFSVYLPSDFNHEIATTGNSRSNSVLTVTPNDTNATLMALNLWRETGDTYTHWWLITYTGSTSTGESGGTEEFLDLGDVVADSDLGRWTDFVIRYRVNPWPSGTTCNPSTGTGSGSCTLVTGSRNTSYTGGTGVLQIWKANGTASPRAMSLVLDRTNVPVGLVPFSDTTKKFLHGFRQYKYGWKKNSTNSTAPIYIGFDEIRMGQTVRDGTGYSDVHPGGLEQP